MNVVLVLYCVKLIIIFQPSLINGSVCYCTPGLSDSPDGNPCEQENNTGYYTQVCTTGVCFMQQVRIPNLLIQGCSNSFLYRAVCAYYNYYTLDNGTSFCCVGDYCNSAENFWEFRANLSATTTNGVVQGTSSIDNLMSETSWIPTASSTGQETSSIDILISATSWIPTAPPTDVQSQPQQGSIILLVGSFGGVVVVSVIIITILMIIILSTRRKSILSQKVDTQHYTKPPADQLKFKFDLLPIYSECDQGFVENVFLTKLDKKGCSLLNRHLNFIPGNAISDNILIAVRESRYIMPIITENFLKSKYCIYELEQSVLRMIKSKSTCIIPVTTDIKLLPECLKALVTGVVLEDNCTNYSTCVDRIMETVGSPMYCNNASS